MSRALVTRRLDSMDDEAMTFTECSERLEITGPAPAEAEVGAENELAHAELVDEHTLDKRLRLHTGELFGEVDDDENVDAQLGQHLLLELGGQDAFRCLFRAHDTHRVRLERHRHRRRCEGLGALLQELHRFLMPEVDAVEVPERDRGPRVVGQIDVRVVADFHRLVSLLLRTG